MKECHNIEWKENWNDEYLKWVCAFANAEGGSLCVGIDDRGKIFPLKSEKKLLEDLPNKIRDTLGVIADVKLISTGDGDYIRIDVPAYSNLINYRGRFYYRSGSTTQELKGTALERMLLKKQGISWDSVTVPGVSIEDLSEKAFLIFRKAAIKNRRMPESFLQEDRGSILENLNLIHNGGLTRAAILLFHPMPEKYIFGAILRVAYFRSESDLIHQDDLTGSLFEQVDLVQDILKIKYLKAYVSFEGFQRKEDFLYPDAALREAILNAVIHKNYATGIPIQIKVFDDMIRIYNSGVMPEDWTLENLFKPHASRPYNPLIAGAFYRSGEIDTWGRGIQKITDACKVSGLALPEYEYFAGSGFSLCLNASEKLKRIAREKELSPSPPASREKSRENSRENSREKILELLKADPEITVKRLAEQIGISVKGVEKQIAILKGLNRIRRIGADRSGHWEVIANEKSE